MRLLETDSYDFKWLKQKYPEVKDFYYDYFEGGYLNVAYTSYFDENEKLLETESHGHYG